MSTMTADLDFLTSAGESSEAESAAVAAKTTPGGPPRGNAARVISAGQKSRAAESDDEASAADDAKDETEQISEVLLPSRESDEDEVPPAKKTAKAKTEKSKAEKAKPAEEADEDAADEDEEAPSITARQPARHDPKLLHLASVWGIGPDEAAGYQTARALLGEIHLRELDYQRRNAAKDGKATKTKPGDKTAEAEDDFAPPELVFDEEIDPKLKGSVEGLRTYAQKLKDHAEKQISAMREEIETLRSEHEQAASERAQETEAKVAQMLDEEVASWGEEYAELLGVPSAVWQANAAARNAGQRGTKQHAEVMKFRDYVEERMLGFFDRTGRRPSLEDIQRFGREAKGALWPDRAQREVRNEVATKLRKQKGGVAMRPGRSSREVEPVEQGDEAAKDAIVQYYESLGFDQWGRKRRAG